MVLRRISPALACLLMLGLLSACQPSAKPPRVMSAPAPASPLLDFVTSAQVGQSGMVTDPQMGDVGVTVIEEYPAASGEICRRYSVETAQRQSRAGAACYNGISWELAPLIP
jgi:hypothetical protein